MDGKQLVYAAETGPQLLGKRAQCPTATQLAWHACYITHQETTTIPQTQPRPISSPTARGECCRTEAAKHQAGAQHSRQHNGRVHIQRHADEGPYGSALAESKRPQQPVALVEVGWCGWRHDEPHEGAKGCQCGEPAANVQHQVGRGAQGSHHER